MAKTREEARAERLAELKEAREAKAEQMAADRYNDRAAAIEAEAAKYYNLTSVQVGATTEERVEALKDIRAAENLATYSTASEFKAIPFDKLDAKAKGQLAYNAEYSGVTITDPKTGEIRKPTPEEYYNLRGGINQAGYAGDSYIAGLTLTEREYEIARLEGGKGTTGAGSAINLASAKKAYNYYIAQGNNPVLAYIRSGYPGVNVQVRANALPEGGGNLYLYDGKYYDEFGKEVDKNIGANIWSTYSTKPTTVSTASPLVTATPTGLDTATSALIKSLQNQIATLTSNTQQAAIDKAAADAAAKQEKAENAIAVLTDRFTKYGLASLVPKIKQLAISGASESTITLQLQESEEYKTRFKANQDRIKKGLRVLDPSDYLNLEDDYRQILRAYGLKAFDTDAYVQQFIANDIATTELSNRVVTAVQRVQNADPVILTTLRSFYGISDNDLVAYVLDPNQQFQKIERQVAAAEIGAAAGLQGISTGVSVAEQLAAQGVTKAQAQKGYATIADILPTAEKLSGIYDKALPSYGLGEAEQEVFNTLASAQRKRRALAEREIAEFSGASGLSKSALSKQIGGTY